LEVFRSSPNVVSTTEINKRRLTRLELPRALTAADCTAETARAWGITAEIHSSPDYVKTQEWAAAFAQSGFDGIYYFLRHDPAQRLTGIALFGPAGSPPGFPVGISEAIGPDLIQAVADRFGIRVVR